MSASRDVKIGGQTQTIPEFGSFKAILASELIGEVTDKVGKVLDAILDYRRDYAEKNKSRITRQDIRDRAGQLREFAAELAAQAAKVEDKDERAAVSARAQQLANRADSWEKQIEEMGDKPHLEVPGRPTGEEVGIHVFPLVTREKLLGEVMALLALAVAPDDELEEAWLDGNAVEGLPRKGRELALKLKLGEEIALAVAVWEVAAEQLRPHLEELKKLQSLAKRELQTPEQPKDEEDSTSESQPDQPTSSTPSPAPTDGDQSGSSSGTPTASTAPSPVG